jgi:hypothetical protein
MITVKVFNEVIKQEGSSSEINNDKLKEIIDFCELSDFDEE